MKKKILKIVNEIKSQIDFMPNPVEIEERFYNGYGTPCEENHKEITEEEGTSSLEKHVRNWIIAGYVFGITDLGISLFVKTNLFKKRASRTILNAIRSLEANYEYNHRLVSKEHVLIGDVDFQIKVLDQLIPPVFKNDVETFVNNSSKLPDEARDPEIISTSTDIADTINPNPKNPGPPVK